MINKSIFILNFLCLSLYSMDVSQFLDSITHHKYEATEYLLKNNKKLVHIKANIYAPEFSYSLMTPLHQAARVGNCKAIRLLISIDPSLVHCCNEDKQTPLFFAANKKTAKLLLRHGALSSARDYRQRTPLELFLFDKFNNSYEIAEYLVAAGADINDQKEYFNESLLHKAVEKNGPIGPAKFLLEHGANPELMDKDGVTPFDKALRYGRKTELFEEVGIYIFTTYDSCEDPFALLKDKAAYFKQLLQGHDNNKKKRAQNIISELLFICKKQEKNLFDYAKSKKICLLYDSLFCKKYLFKYITFSDLAVWVGEQGVSYAREYCDNAIIQNREDNLFLLGVARNYPFVFYYNTQNAFHLLRYMIQHHKNLHCLKNNKVDVSGVDKNGDSLLHIAVKSKNADAIEWLIHQNIDCTLKNNKEKTVIEYLQEKGTQECKRAFVYALHNKFFEKRLSKKNEKLVPTKWFCNTLYLYEGQTIFFEMLSKRPEKCTFFLKKGTCINYKNQENVSPLALVISKVGEKSWEKYLMQYNILFVYCFNTMRL